MPPKAEPIHSELESLPKAKAAFIEPMLLLRTGALPEAANWLYELKLIPLRSSICDRTDDTLDCSNTNKIWLSRKTHRDLYVCMANFAMEPARAGRVDAQ